MTLQQKLVQADDYLDMLKDKAKETDELAKENLQLRIDYQQANDIIVEQQKEIERLKERLDIAQTAYLSVNEKNDKAIEYIETNIEDEYEYHGLLYENDEKKKLLDILKGVDKE